MASAAAVAVDQALEPEGLNLAEPDQIGGSVTSAIVPPDEEVPNNLSELQEDDEDEDDVVRSRPRGPQMNGAPGEEEEELGLDDDLFGDGDGADEEEPEAPQRTLDDEDLDSGDDEDREDRLADEEDAREPEEEKEMAVMEAGLGRQPLPEPSDGEMYLTKVPKFISIDPKAWHHTTYQPPTTDHHRDTAGPGFSAYNTAISTAHWRKSPSNPQELQSNARLLRWSDGTLTLQFASNPTQQFTIEGKPLAPRQIDPSKPTPTSRKSGQRIDGGESYTYLCMPDPHNQLLRITHKITAGLSILPSAETTDEALVNLQNSLAAIAQGKNKNAGGIEIIPIDEDPELAKKKAEVAERDKMRAQKRRDAAETRERERSNRTFGRSSTRHGGGLSASMLEDDELGGERGRPKGKRQAQKERRRRNSEYSDDEDFGRKRGNFANDEYDEEDEFIAGSDEEEEAIASSDEDDGIVEDAPRRKSASKPSAKRPSPDVEEDAEGEDEEEVVQTSRVKRRRVIDDDDEE